MLRRLHRYISLSLLVVWLLQAVTGVVNVFYRDIDAALLDHQQPALDITRLAQGIDALQEARAPARLSSVYASGGDPGQFDVFLHTPDNGLHVLRVDGSGAVLRERPWANSIERSGWLQSIRLTHETLFLGDRALLFVGLSGLFLLTNLFLGIKLAWAKHGQWRAALTARASAQAPARLRAWHRALGLWMALPAVVVVFCGIGVAWTESLEALAGNPVEAPAVTSEDDSGRRISLATALATALAQYEGARLSIVSMPAEDQPYYAIRLLQDGELRRVFGKTTVFISARDGSILADYDALELPLANRIINNFYAVHTGAAGGLPGRMVVFATGVCLIGMITLGMALWLVRRRRALVPVLCVAMLGVPVDDSFASETAGACPTESTITYEWFNEGSPAGEQTISCDPGGHFVSNMRISWNNREFILHNSFDLDAQGYVTHQSLTGQSAFGAVIDESYRDDGQIARWRSAAEEGSRRLDHPGFYVPARSGASATLAALIRKAIAELDSTVDLLPAGSVRVHEVTRTRIGDGDSEGEVTLYSITGLSFAPTYVWLDEDLRLFSHGFWGLAMVPAGWGSTTVDELNAIQKAFESRHYADIAANLGKSVERPLLIENVAIIDVETGKLLPRRQVLIEDGVIARVSQGPIDMPGADRIDGGGLTMLPGLWDMHAHTDFFSYHGGILNIAGGVTSVRDMGSDHENLMRLTRAFDAKELIGPNVYRAGFIDKKSPYAASRAVETFDEAMERVHWYADHGYMQIKLYSSIAPEWVAPLAAAASSRGMRVGGHIPAFMTAEDAVRSGFDEIQHINMVFLNFLATDDDDTRTRLRFYLYGDEAGNLDLMSREVDDFIELLKGRGTVIDPTVAVFDSMIGHRAGEPDPMFEPVMHRFPISEYRSMLSPGFDITDENADAWEASREASLKMLRRLYEGGIQIVPGTDALPGFAMHRELELYERAGIPNAAIIRMATLDSARLVDVGDEYGSIEVGKRADLVLVDGNPLEDMSTVRNVRVVIKGNRRYHPESLLESIGIRPAD